MAQSTQIPGSPAGIPSSFKVLWLRPSWTQPGKWSRSHPPPSLNNLKRQSPSIKPKAPRTNINSFHMFIVRFLNIFLQFFKHVGKPLQSWCTCSPACLGKFSPSTSPKFTIFTLVVSHFEAIRRWNTQSVPRRLSAVQAFGECPWI